MIYYAGFDATLLTDLSTITVRQIGGGTPASVNLASGVTGPDYNGDNSTLFFHYDRYQNFNVEPEHVDGDTNGNEALQKWSVEGYAEALEDAIQAAATTAGFPSPTNFTVSCARTTAIYTISHSSTDFELLFGNNASRLFLGYDADDTAVTSTKTGDYPPTYTINPTLDGASSPGVGDMLNYEPGNIAALGVADSTRTFGISRDYGPLYRDWIQQFETKAKTIRFAADTVASTATHPWTFQGLFEHCRTVFPFIVVQGFGETYDEAFRFRSEGSSWTPERAGPGNDNQFHIPFQTIVEGQIVDETPS